MTDKINQVLILILGALAIFLASVHIVKKHACQCEDCKCVPCDCVPTKVNSKALGEIKGQDCVDCKPVAKPIVAPKKVDKLNETKTGLYTCGKCGNKRNGADFHTYWTLEGEPVTPCCQACWDHLTIEQRKSEVKRWATANKLSSKTAERYASQVQ